VEKGRAKPVLINAMVEPHTEGRTRVIRSILGKAIKQHQLKRNQAKKATQSVKNDQSYLFEMRYYSSHTDLPIVEDMLCDSVVRILAICTIFFSTVK
jgi:hypothetical protein